MELANMLTSLTHIKPARTFRVSSWDNSGRNQDSWLIEPGETRMIGNLKGPGCITHIWMTQNGEKTFRNVLLKMFWDDEKNPSVLVPLGDFFCLGNNLTNSFESLPFTASAKPDKENQLGARVALNCNLQMPFNRFARIELVNEGKEAYRQYFYIDYEISTEPWDENIAYLHAQFNRENPCDGWGHEIKTNAPESNIVNKEKEAWENNYHILQAEGTGHYIGCNLSITNFQGTWWGEGDDMIWIDGYSWPPDLHGTGSEDYLNQAWGSQDNAYLFNGTSIYEKNTAGYQTSYVFHLTNPIRFRKEIKATIEHGHGNHLSNEMSSVAYWYQLEPHKNFSIAPVQKRQPIESTVLTDWQRRAIDPPVGTTQRKSALNLEMEKMKHQWARGHK